MPSPESELIKRLNLYIDKNLDNPDFSTDIICQELGVSRSQLYRIIKEKFQISPSIYIRKQKLLKAKDLLENSNLKISEISYKIGIDSPQNFSKYFTKEFGANPTEFRKNISSTEEEISKPDIDNQEVVLPPKKSKSFSYFGLIVLVLSVVGLGLYFWRAEKVSFFEPSEDTDSFEKSIAILPFKNLGDTSKTYFSEGIMEEIHNSLASLNTIKVISTTSSNKYSNTKKSIQDIGNELHVGYVLNGSVLQVDQQIRIRVELISVTDDRVIWSENFEGETKNIFRYMNMVSAEVAEKLNQKLNVNQAKKLDKNPTESLEAYNAFLIGQKLLQERTAKKIEASIIKFDEAIKLEPTFADAFTNRALAYYVLGEDQFIDLDVANKMAEKDALTAIRLDSENGRAYAVLGNIYKAQNKWEQAITTFQIALKFSPNDAQINYWYSLTARSIGQLDEAIRYSTKAVSLDPLASNIYGGHLIGCAYAGRFDLAEKAIKDGDLIFNDALLFHNAKGAYFVTLKNYKEALKEFEICKRLNPGAVFIQTWYNYTLAKLKQPAPVQLFLRSLPEKAENHKYFAIVYAGLDDKQKCLKYLELAAKNSDSPNYLKVSPIFKFLHKEPRFNAILQKLGLLNPAFSAK